MSSIPASASGSLRSTPTTVLRRLEWRARHAVTTLVSGEYRSAFRGRGMELDQVVKYQWGDDLRDIDWNVTARLGEPYRKCFVEERDLSVIFIFEDSPALQFGSQGRTRRDTLLETAALLMLISSINRDRVGLLYSAPGKSWFERALPGHKGVLRVASRLLSQEAPSFEGPSGCSIPWQLMRKVASRGSVLLWLGPFAPASTPQGWSELQHRYQTVGVRADDSWDTELPADAQFAAYDPLSGHLTTIDTSSAAERAAHARWRERREAWFAELFPHLDERLTVRNTEDPLQALMAYFHRTSSRRNGRHRQRRSRAHAEERPA
jgi:uncharacterized protein (DUF58 family)